MGRVAFRHEPSEIRPGLVCAPNGLHVGQAREGFDLGERQPRADGVEARHAAQNLSAELLDLCQQRIRHLRGNVHQHPALRVDHEIQTLGRHARGHRLVLTHPSGIDELRVEFALGGRAVLLLQ